MNENSILHIDQPAHYRLQMQGRITADWADWLKTPSVTFAGEGPAATTIVTGLVTDQAALFGLLSFVRDLAVPLIALELVQSLDGSIDNDVWKGDL